MSFNLLKNVTDSTVLRATRLSKTYLKLHITILHVSPNIGHQAFKIVDENCCASVL
jgi:hypothetical protein